MLLCDNGRIRKRSKNEIVKENFAQNDAGFPCRKERYYYFPELAIFRFGSIAFGISRKERVVNRLGGLTFQAKFVPMEEAMKPRMLRGQKINIFVLATTACGDATTDWLLLKLKWQGRACACMWLSSVVANVTAFDIPGTAIIYAILLFSTPNLKRESTGTNCKELQLASMIESGEPCLLTWYRTRVV